MRNKIVSLILIVLIVLAGIGISKYLQRGKRRIHRWKRHALPVYVETEKATRVDTRFVISGFGNVEPFRKITLTSEVSGRIVFLAKGFYDGGFFKKGDIIARIDDRDYRDDLVKKESTLESLKEDLKIEEGRRRVALKEYKMAKGIFGKISSDSLYLTTREPYIKKILDSIKKAQADVRIAKRRLKETVIRAPFNCYILARYIDIGSRVSQNGRIADLVSSDGYYLKAHIPADELGWLGNIARDPVKVVFAGGKVYRGRIVSVSPQVDSKGLMADVVVFIKGDSDPTSPLKINNYATVEIEGKRLSSITRIPIAALRENNRVWIYDRGRLKIKQVDVVFSLKRYFYTYDIKPGSDVIVSQIATPVENMRLYRAKGSNGRNGMNRKNRAPYWRSHDKNNKVFHR